MVPTPVALRLVTDTMPGMTLDLHGFESWMRAWGASDATIATRMTTARALLAAGIDPRSATRVDLTNYIAANGWAGWTLSTYFSSLRSLFAWLHESGQIDADPTDGMRRPRRPRSQPRPLTLEQVHALLGDATPRVAAYLTLALYAGLRAHEIAAVQASDVTQDSIYVVGKGGKAAHLPTHPRVWAMARTMPRLGYWFPSSSAAGHVTREAVSHAVGKHLRSHGIAGSIHRARHTYATTLLRSGVNIRVVQTLMRHESLTSTEVYTQVLDTERTDAIAGLDFAA